VHALTRPSTCGVPRADGFSSKVNKANVVIWTADLIGHNKVNHDKTKRMEAIAKKICHLRMEIEMTQNGIIVDGFKEWENVVCWPGKLLTHAIEVRNELNNNVLCTIKAIKGDIMTKQGVIIGRDVQFVRRAGFLGEGSRQSIIVSFLALMNNAPGGKKSLLMFDLKATNSEYDKDDFAAVSFLIMRYLHLHVSDPDYYKLLKPSLPYVRKRFGKGNMAGGAAKVFTWDWMDAALSNYLRGESTAYAGVLLDQDCSMKWHWRKKRTKMSNRFYSLFTTSNVPHDVKCIQVTIFPTLG
jgi:hypothetical protein